MAYKDVVLNDNPLAYWRAEETSGSTLSDETGNGNSASLSGSYDLTASGLIDGGGSAVDITGVDGQAKFGSALSGLSDVTFEVWFQPSTIAEGNIMEAGAGVIGTKMYLESTGEVSVLTENDSVTITSTTSLSAGTTYHLVHTHDKAGGEVTLYINATEEATGTISSDASGSDVGAFGKVTSAIDYEKAVKDAAKGVYDEVAGYDKALTSTQVQEHYDAGTATGAGISGTFAVTDAKETVSAAGQTEVSGTFTLTDSGETITLGGATIIAGAASITDSGELISAVSALQDITGTASITDGAEEIDATGGVKIAGTATLADGSEQVVIIGENDVTGSLSFADLAAQIVATGSVEVQGSLALTDSGETISARERVPARLATVDVTLTDIIVVNATLTD